MTALRRFVAPTLVMCCILPAGCAPSGNGELPVRVPALPRRAAFVRNPVTFDQVTNITGGTKAGLQIDLGDWRYRGTVFSGPYPFEAGETDYDYARYRLDAPLKRGKGLIRIDKLMVDKYNANDWPADGPMTAAYRLELYRDNLIGPPAALGFYDMRVSFTRDADGVFHKAPTIVEGPLVNLVTSDDPTSCVIAWETLEPTTGTVHVARGDGAEGTGREFADDDPSRRHAVTVTGLTPARAHAYYVVARDGEGATTRTRAHRFDAAPEPGTGTVTFAFVSDSREGVGGGERNCMGHNRHVLARIANDARRRGARFFLFGGDLVNGYTSETEDFRLQLKGWKHTMAGYWRTAPVYPVMGNHETLLNAFGDGTGRGGALDKWPYATDSAEAVFAREFWNPLNGPAPSDSRRPPYRENVYSFQYGPVLCIAFNNNYWYTTGAKVHTWGGCPEGYILNDQLEWIEQTLAEAERDKSIRYILLYAQEPVFPCGGHVKDGMWWNGDNSVRAAVKGPDGTVRPAAQGIIEVRNRFWEAVARSSKVAAVLAGDEHEYHRLRVDAATPVGLPDADDADGDGKLETYSPNAAFAHPVWQITAGTGGAPYYARQKTPWTPELLSSQHGYCLFTAGPDGISMDFYTLTGQRVDHVADLMAVKE